jgi:hypothetical protein
MQKRENMPKPSKHAAFAIIKGEKQRPVTTCMKMKCCQQAQRQNENLLSHHAYEWDMNDWGHSSCMVDSSIGLSKILVG